MEEGKVKQAKGDFKMTQETLGQFSLDEYGNIIQDDGTEYGRMVFCYHDDTPEEYGPEDYVEELNMAWNSRQKEIYELKKELSRVNYILNRVPINNERTMKTLYFIRDAKTFSYEKGTSSMMFKEIGAFEYYKKKINLLLCDIAHTVKKIVKVK